MVCHTVGANSELGKHETLFQARLMLDLSDFNQACSLTLPLRMPMPRGGSAAPV
jgi:hypothetical protein